VKDPVARILGVTAVALALMALVVSAYATTLQSRTREQIQALGEAIRAAMQASSDAGSGARPSLGRPPPTIDSDPE
jgi:Tfp pilus assembly protein PilV